MNKIETRGRKKAADPVRSLSLSLPASQWHWVEAQDPTSRSAPIRKLVAAAMAVKIERVK